MKIKTILRSEITTITKEILGAVQSICNMRNKTSNEVPVGSHNYSNYESWVKSLKASLSVSDKIQRST